jgi:hypothetical protein
MGERIDEAQWFVGIVHAQPTQDVLHVPVQAEWHGCDHEQCRTHRGDRPPPVRRHETPAA